MFRQPGLWGRLCLVLAAMGSLYLAAISLTQTPMLGCDAASSCYSVLGTRWAFLFGIPASFPAIALYLITILAAGAFEAREHRTWLGLLGEVCVIGVTVAAVWFLGVQGFTLSHFCLWCCLTHGFGLLGVFGLTWERRNHRVPDETEQGWAEGSLLQKDGWLGVVRTLAVFAAVGLLAAGPFVAPPAQQLAIARTTDTLRSQEVEAIRPVGPPLLGLAQGKVIFHPTELPLLGSPQATEFAAVLTDFTCDYCRQYHAVLAALVKQRGPDFAIALLPGARDDNGRLVQHVMLCLFKADPSKYALLSQALLAGTHPATGAAVRATAENYLGAAAWALAEITHGPWAAEQILAARKLHVANQAFANSSKLPQLMAGNQILIGYYAEMRPVNAFVEAALHPEKHAATAALVNHPVSHGEDTSPSEKEAQAKASAVAHPGAPMLELRQKIMDLGTLPAGQPKTCQVEFTNSGKEPLKISWIGLDAGCEVVRSPREIIPQGGMATITLAVTAPETGHLFQRKISIHSNAPVPTVLQIQGHVAAPAIKTANAALN